MITRTTRITAMAHNPHSAASRGEQPVSRQLLDNLVKELSLSEAIIVTSLPRGGLQVVQPQKLGEVFAKSYEHDFATQDDLTWQAIAENTAVRARAGSAYLEKFL